MAAAEEHGQDIFVTGRLCLFGEHSDWAGEYRDQNSDIVPGQCIVCGTNEGLFAKCAGQAELKLSMTTNCCQEGAFEASFEDIKHLKDVASSDNFWRYAAGTAVIILTELNDVLRFIKEPRDEILVPKTGVRIDNYKTTLPVRKGLSSSAAACVLVARAFSAVFGWNLSQRAEMELAYRGERLTSSQCGRMDQACAFGCRPVLLTFDGQSLDVQALKVGADLHFVVADLNAGKDTVIILRDLQRAFPFPSNSVESGVHQLLGSLNVDIVQQALEAIESGEAEMLGQLMARSLTLMDKYGAAACPTQLAAPVLHKVVHDADVSALVLGSKGVGSNGDGTVQFLCASKATAADLQAVLLRKFEMQSHTLTIPKTA